MGAGQIEVIREASEALECLVRGIGVVDPDEAKCNGIEGVSP